MREEMSKKQKKENYEKFVCVCLVEKKNKKFKHLQNLNRKNFVPYNETYNCLGVKTMKIFR